MQARFAASFHDNEPSNVKINLPAVVEPFSDSKTNTPPTPLTREALAAMESSSGETTTATNSNSAFASSPVSSQLSASKSPGLPPPGLAPPPSSFVSQLFYETVHNKPSVSCQTPSSTGATKGEDSGDTIDCNSKPVTDMSRPRDGPSGQDDPAARPHPRQSASAPQRSFPRHSLPSQHSFYQHQIRSAPAQEQYASPGTYSLPGPGFLGQYMSSQPPHSMPLQSPVTFFSTPFAHPGIHAHDPSGMGLPFPPPPPLGRAYTYAAPAPVSEDEGRPSQGYGPGPPSPFAPPTGASQPAAGSSSATSGSQFSPQHAFGPPMHFSPTPSPAHYAYPSHSYAQPSAGMYSYTPSPYPQTFYTQPAAPASPEDPNKGGTWWYLPPSSNSQQYDPPPYPGLYPVQGYQQPMQMTGRPEFDRTYPSSSSGAGPSGQAQSAQHSHIPRLHESSFPPPSPVLPSPVGRLGLSPHGTPNPPSSSRSPASPAQSRRRDNSPPSRKSYHPAPPPNRSEWVMWVGNVPSDATHDELYRFFNQPEPQHPVPPGTSAVLSSRLVQPPSSPIPDERWGGVSSVFLISRSNCAFINFDNESCLNSAVSHFNGKPLRPKDPRCPRLVCRVRRRDDDLRAGVGWQRGMGLHTRWVEEQRKNAKGKGRETRDGPDDEHVDGPPTSPSTYLAPSSASDPSPPIAARSPIVDDPQFSSPEDASRKPRHGSSGDRSRASGSTNSSFLSRYFPKRYFILKSLSQHDLNLSVERGVWATQLHNEGVLDQAYRNSQDVFLIFGANKSGEFFGYARMAGPIFHNDRVDQPPWAPRSSGGRRSSSPIAEEDEGFGSRASFLSPSSERPLQESPAAMSPGQENINPLQIDIHALNKGPGVPAGREINTAPAEPEEGHKRLTRPPLQGNSTEPPQDMQFYSDPQIEKYSAHAKGVTDDGKYVIKAPGPRPSGHLAHSTSGIVHQLEGVRINPRADDYEGGIVEKVQQRDNEHEQDGMDDQRPKDKPEGWGREFKIQWIRTERLPFHRTRHLRNPWNHDKEVKVSRDGTELEPTVGQRLLEEWDKPDPAASSPQQQPQPQLQTEQQLQQSPSSTVANRAGGSRVSRPPVRAGVGSTAASAQGMPSFSSQMARTSSGAPSSNKHVIRGGQS